jgi:tRNA(Arg) A34 adenosine deaminase TadA
MKHINTAINAAMNSDMVHMHGAVIVKGGKQIAIGYNRRQTRFLKENVPSIHAEIAALQTIIYKNAKDPKERLLCS